MIAASASELEATTPVGDGSIEVYSKNINNPSINAEGSSHAEYAYVSTFIPTRPSVKAHSSSADKNAPEKSLAKALQFSRPIAMHIQGQPRYPSTERSTIHGRGQKARGKLSSSRRQEVQNMRKQGACIRCRMLRKTVCFRTLFLLQLP